MSSKRLATNNNQLPEGYKKTEIGVIPEDWDVVTLGNIGQSLIGLTYKPENIRNYGTLVLRSSNIKDNKLTYNDNVYIDDKLSLPSRVIVEEGDILVCVRNGSRQLIGKCALIDSVAAGSAFGAFMSVFRTKVYEFVFYQFQSDEIKKQINEIMGATINQITNKDLNAFQISVPPSEQEQKAIAQTLSDVDALIAALDKHIAKKRNIKTGTMQQLLTGKTRLPGFGEGKGYKKSAIGVSPEDWEVVLLSKLSHIATGQTPPTKNRNYYGYEYLFVSPADMGNAKYIINTLKKLSKLGFFICRIYPPMSILFTCIGSTIGKCGIVTSESTSNQQINAIFPSELVNNEYLYYQLVRSAHRIKSKAGEQAVPIVNKTEFGATLVLVCSIEEQKAIAQVLSDIDTEITALEKRRAKTQAIKQGMMQELLTGRTRLKIEHPDDPITKNSNG